MLDGGNNHARVEGAGLQVRKIAVGPAVFEELLAEVERRIDHAVENGERLAASEIDFGAHCVLGGLVDRVEGDDGEGGDRCGDDDGDVCDEVDADVCADW